MTEPEFPSGFMDWDEDLPPDEAPRITSVFGEPCYYLEVRGRELWATCGVQEKCLGFLTYDEDTDRVIRVIVEVVNAFPHLCSALVSAFELPATGLRQDLSPEDRQVKIREMTGLLFCVSAAIDLGMKAAKGEEVTDEDTGDIYNV